MSTLFRTPDADLTARATRRRVVVCVTLGVLLTIAAQARKPPQPRLTRFFTDWRASVAHLLTEDERATFDAIGDASAREEFIRHFWAARGPIEPGTEGPLSAWRRRFDVALDRYGSFEDDRARAIMIAGVPPDERIVVCDDVVERLEIWRYTPWHIARSRGTASESTDGDLVIAFYRDGPFGNTSVHHWSPATGFDVLVTGGTGRTPASSDEILGLMRAAGCLRARGEAEAVRRVLTSALDWPTLRAHMTPPPADPVWLDAYTGGPADTNTDARFELDFPGRYNDQRTVVRGRIAVPTHHFARTIDGRLYDRLEVIGDVYAGTRLVDSFRIVNYLAGTPPADEVVRVAFHRRLRPGAGYRVALRVVPGHGLAVLRADRVLDVPRLDEEAEAPAGSRLGFAGLTRGDVGVLVTFPSVELRVPGPEVAGDTEIEAVSTGGPIDRVQFTLAGTTTVLDETPPWSARFDLGPRPEKRAVEVTAFDAAGRALASDRLMLNAAPPRFAIRLGEPRRDDSGARHVDIEVDVPAGETLDRVDVFQDDQRLATFDRPPFTARLLDITQGPTSFVRAVASLKSGARMEDLVVADSSVPFDNVDVRLVELYVSVLDRQGRPVTGLDASAFHVRENGKDRPILRVNQVASLPVVVGLLMDTSTSMRRGLGAAVQSAQRFFETVIGERDLAMLTAFNHEIRQLAPFTHDVARLDDATAGLRAWGTTRLHDGIAYALYGFGGRPGRRALVVLSDGRDVDSDFDADQVLEAALRAGVAVYPVVLESDKDAEFPDLNHLADETGGRFFRVAAVAQLDGVYARIEEDLRAQYLLVIQPAEDGAGGRGGRGSYRQVEVSVEVEGKRGRLETRTVSGYRP